MLRKEVHMQTEKIINDLRKELDDITLVAVSKTRTNEMAKEMPMQLVKKKKIWDREIYLFFDIINLSW